VCVCVCVCTTGGGEHTRSRPSEVGGEGREHTEHTTDKNLPCEYNEDDDEDDGDGDQEDDGGGGDT
jgi:hypothetical protein